MNRIEAFVFWGGLLLSILVWVLLGVASIVKFQFQWILVVVVAITLSAANLYGYARCAKGMFSNRLWRLHEEGSPLRGSRKGVSCKRRGAKSETWTVGARAEGANGAKSCVCSRDDQLLAIRLRRWRRDISRSRP